MLLSQTNSVRTADGGLWELCEEPGGLGQLDPTRLTVPLEPWTWWTEKHTGQMCACVSQNLKDGR